MEDKRYIGLFFIKKKQIIFFIFCNIRISTFLKYFIFFIIKIKQTHLKGDQLTEQDRQKKIKIA